MPSVGTNLDSAITGLRRNVDQAVQTVSELSKQTEKITAEAEKANKKTEQGDSGGINVFV